MSADWVPTARLRWERREIFGDPVNTTRVLQQWYAADVPGYLRRTAEGEWRDVPEVEVKLL